MRLFDLVVTKETEYYLPLYVTLALETEADVKTSGREAVIVVVSVFRELLISPRRRSVFHANRQSSPS